MAYIVLVAGAVMALFGALAIITGYPIIQVERGWATVIAGSSLLAGGLVTVALGLVLRAILGLGHRFSISSGLVGQTTTAAAIEPPVVPIGVVQDHAAPAALGASMIAVPAAALALAETHEPAGMAPSTSEAAATPPWIDHTPTDPIIREPDVLAAHPAQTPHEPSPSPPIDDWLDRAFADIAHDPEPSVPVASHRPDAVDARHALIDDGETLYADAGHRHASDVEHELEPEQPHHEPTTHEDAAAPGPASFHAGHDDVTDERQATAAPSAVQTATHETEAAVIGRYEADGTSYTMYADGSIEAQSEAGVYRFASMAELKAFIET